MAARVSWRLARIGVTVTPYYWYREGCGEVSLPPLRDEASYNFGFFESADLRAFDSLEPGVIPAERLAAAERDTDSGRCYFGVKYHDEIVAIMSIDLDRATYLGKSFELTLGDVYLGDMFTREAFRGKNIAPHLRNRAYVALRKMGKTTLYSFSDIFNGPALRFKEKLGAKAEWLGLCVEIRRCFRHHWRLKTYKN